MLIRLLRTYLVPYRRPAGSRVVILQLVGTMASLFLPSLNAAIIDEGVAKGDTGFIWRTGERDARGQPGADDLRDRRHLLRRQRPPWASAATSAGRSSTRVLAFSSRELNQFGAPSLITRTTNDVQQVQMLVLLSATMFVAAPITMIGGVIMALREDVGLSWLVAVAVPLLAISIFLGDPEMRPLFRLMQTRIDLVNRVLREQITGIRVVRAFVREPYETARFAEANGAPDRDRHLGRPADGVDLPDRDVHPEHLQRGGALVRRAAGRRGADADRLADRLPHLPGADPDVGDDGDLLADDRPPGRGLRRAHPARCWRPTPRSCCRTVR